MEKVIFSMPDDPEMFIAALSAVQCWRMEQESQINHVYMMCDKHQYDVEKALELKKIGQGHYYRLCMQLAAMRQDNENRRSEVTIHLPNASFDFLKPAFGKSLFVYGPQNINRLDWDLAHRFDPVRAHKLAVCTQRHAASAFGILIGAEGLSLADLSAVPVDDGNTIDVLLLDFPAVGEVIKFLEDKGKSYKVADCVLCWSKICNADMVVGPRSAATYLASCLHKRVVELYPVDVHRRWLSKWDNKNYQMIYNDQFSASLVWRAMEGLWDRPHTVNLATSASVYKTQTGLRTSVAGLAVGWSQEQEEPR